jgi:hypothetical protein
LRDQTDCVVHPILDYERAYLALVTARQSVYEALLEVVGVALVELGD